MISSQPPVQAKPNSLNQYDKDTQKKIAIGVIAIALLGVLLPLFIFFYPEYQRDQLIKNGLPAGGEIVSIKPTGNTYNDQPQASIVVKVTLENGETFEAETKMIINAIYAPQFQPGKRVKVRYDANDRTNIAIEETESGQR
ncbi:DUF3592 domain-containing protein [Patescibacteria group bacterium]|jgi:hypothetical protein|nr:DUF3592 domain-containing protein [Patescibacteria group bacterium]